MINANVRTLTIPAVDGVYERFVPVNANTTLDFDSGSGGTVTAGTVAIEAATVNSKVFSPVTGISPIDFATPLPQTIIDTPVQRVELTLAGFAGTATTIKLTATTWS